MTKLAEVFNVAAPGARAEYKSAFNSGGSLIEEAAINTPLRIAHFLAQVLHECDEGRITFEDLTYTTQKRLLEIFGVGNHSAAVRPEEADGLLGNPQALAERVYGLGNPKKAKELGNLKSGDGYRYRGGGLMQTTGGYAYRRYGERWAVDFAGKPELIVSAEHALKPAISEWSDNGLNAYADKNDIETITKIINGGFNGLPDRKKRFERIWKIVSPTRSAQEAWRVAGASEDTLWLQRALNVLGYLPRLKEDGKFGPMTEAAVRWFQKLAKVRVDGIAGPVTRAAIRLRLDVIR